MSGAFVLALGAFFVAPPWTANDALSYRAYVLHAWWPHVRGTQATAALDGVFTGPFGYRYADQVAVSELIKARRPARSDRLHVRGFDPMTYVLTGLFSSSRFMSEAPLTDQYGAKVQEKWRVEHYGALSGANAPRFVVARVGNVIELRMLEAKGYGLVGSRERYVVLEKGLGQRRLADDEILSSLVGKRLSGMLGITTPFTAHVTSRTSMEVETFAKRGEIVFEVRNANVCVLGMGKPLCFAIHRHGEEYLAAQEDGQEVAVFRITN